MSDESPYGETVYKSALSHVYYKAQVLRIELTSCPTETDIDHMWTIVVMFLKCTDAPCVMHMLHVETDDMEPPNANTMFHIAKKLLLELPEFREKIRRVIIQPKIIDDKVKLARAAFCAIPGTKCIKLMISTDECDIQRRIEQSMAPCD